ncbi:MAG: macro domain-containing protein [Alphaproteobacteria bacterium]|nr:macro domain-containing protein [Alphaproteobacteria bacterium]
MTIEISDSYDMAKPFIERIMVVPGDITKQDVDAIAIVVPRNLDFCGGINDSVAQAAGYDVDSFILENIYKPRPMEVYALPGGDLPARNIFVGIMPYYRTEFDRRESDLGNVVRNIMDLARCMLVKRIAFPPLLSGHKGFPKAKVARTIIQGVCDRGQDDVEEVLFVCPDDNALSLFEERLCVIGRSGSDT